MIKASILLTSQQRQIFLFMQAKYSNKQYCTYPWANDDQSRTAFRSLTPWHNVQACFSCICKRWTLL